MSVRLKVSDVVLFHQNNDTASQTLGLVRYIGLVYGSDEQMTQYVGIECMEPISNGHSGTINGYSYFNTEKGYGTHCTLRNVIKRVKTSEMFSICKSKLKTIKSVAEKLKKNKNSNNNNTLTPQSSQRSSILSDYDMFAPKTPFSPRNSLLSQKKGATQGKAIRMIKPRQSLSAALEFPDTEPVAAVISEEHASETERSKKRRKKSKKKIIKKKHKKKSKKQKHSYREAKNHRKHMYNNHENDIPEMVHDNVNKYNVVQPQQQQQLQNHLYIPPIPYSHSSSHSANDLHNCNASHIASHDNKYGMRHQQYDQMDNHLYVPQMLSHSSSHSVPDLDLETMGIQMQPQKNYSYSQHNTYLTRSSSTDENYSNMQSTSAPVTPAKLAQYDPIAHGSNNKRVNRKNEQFNAFIGYKQYLYEPIQSMEAQLKSLQMQNNTSNFLLMSNH